jgi:hypothetical protein
MDMSAVAIEIDKTSGFDDFFFRIRHRRNVEIHLFPRSDDVSPDMLQITGKGLTYRPLQIPVLPASGTAAYPSS